MREDFYRGEPVSREPRHLPAATYNLARVLLARAGGCLFVPIRPMQYLAVLDREEFIFVDRDAGRWIEIAWQGFRPQQRASLEERIAYEAVYYRPSGPHTMRRLQMEFLLALQALDAKQKSAHSPSASAVVDFRRPPH